MSDFLAAAIRIATPLMLAALGGILSECAGVFAVGLEGMMFAGAFAAIIGAWASGSDLVGVLLSHAWRSVDRAHGCRYRGGALSRRSHGDGADREYSRAGTDELSAARPRRRRAANCHSSDAACRLADPRACRPACARAAALRAAASDLSWRCWAASCSRYFSPALKRG